MDLFLFAQGVETAERGVQLLQTIINGGASLILATVAVICGYAFYRQLKANSELEREFRAQVKQDADEKGAAQKEQYQQMLQREHEVQEGQLATVQAVETFTQAVKGLQDTVADQNLRLRAVEDELRRFRG